MNAQMYGLPPAIDKLAEALAVAQGQFTNPHRSKTVKVRSQRTNSEYTFSYATLADVMNVVRKPLAENGLSVIQMPWMDNSGVYMLTTKILHKSGQFIECHLPLMLDNNGNQAFGSALTFMKRYALCAMLGIVADDDDDANAADGNDVQAMQERQPRAPKPDVMEENKLKPPQTKTSRRPTQTIPDDEEVIPPSQVPVPMLEDQSGSDWTRWGQMLLEYMNQARTVADVDQWANINTTPLNTMLQEAPKLHSHLLRAISKSRKDAEIREPVENEQG